QGLLDLPSQRRSRKLSNSNEDLLDAECRKVEHLKRDCHPPSEPPRTGLFCRLERATRASSFDLPLARSRTLTSFPEHRLHLPPPMFVHGDQVPFDIRTEVA